MPHRRRALWITSALALACAEGDAASSASLSGGSGAITSASASISGGAATGDEGSSSGDDDSDAGTDAGTTGGDPSTSGATTGTSGPGSTGNPDGLPDGSECSDDAACMSGNCYTIPLPINDLPAGLCGICDEDQDCVAAGLGVACSVDVANYASTCTDGGIGSFCQSQAACKDGLFCEELIDGVGGLLPMSCGQCRDDADCSGSARCTPQLDVDAYTGHKFCALPGSVANDGMCPLVDGDAVCQSGHCTIVDVGGLIEAGVCGECSSDADCGGGTCQPGTWADGLVGSVCV